MPGVSSTFLHTTKMVYHGAIINWTICCLQNEINITSDGDATLENFCTYQQTVNPADDDNPLHFDYAILITGYVTIYNIMQYIKYIATYTHITNVYMSVKLMYL